MNDIKGGMPSQFQRCDEQIGIVVPRFRLARDENVRCGISLEHCGGVGRCEIALAPEQLKHPHHAGGKVVEKSPAATVSGSRLLRCREHDTNVRLPQLL